ncbi:hypothetical protein SAMN04489740_2736 [Arthrobacter alpinus]|uniref:DNA-binding protein n=1 Tax=Arthrobacter alpinus TaxID=656366 RepID=A0A1H5M3V4_9MICC|nr:hypothetical protein [Arthrobacter alpinus]SEE83900.1 hypothetical protein SAMN04489740_2736 [Arthrobacter alpinus]
MNVYQTPEQAVEAFGYDEQNRPFVSKHEIRRFAKESGIYSKISRGKIVFTREQLEQLQEFVVTQNENKVTATGEIDHFA